MPTIVEQQVPVLVESAVKNYAKSFSRRHLKQRNNPSGTINMKIHNVFVEALGPETRFYSALVRSLDSSLGDMLEKLALDIARLNFDVHRSVQGILYTVQTNFVAELLEDYVSHRRTPSATDYLALRGLTGGTPNNRRHESDYYLIDRSTEHHHLIELKIGGDLDNKKARSEKEAILEQYAILSNGLHADSLISIHFATAYNRFGENQPWTQTRVLQFFAKEELLIGNEFWNFVSKSPDGYELVLQSYKASSHYITDALQDIRQTYLGGA